MRVLAVPSRSTMSYEDEKYENEKVSVEKREDTSDTSVRHIDTAGHNVNAKLANPLEGIPHDQLMANAARFAQEHGLGHLTQEFQKGALVAQDPSAFESLSQLTAEDKAILRREVTHRWSQPWELYYLVIMCSLAAAVQGVSIFSRCFSNLFLTILDFFRWTSPSSMERISSMLPN